MTLSEIEVILEETRRRQKLVRKALWSGKKLESREVKKVKGVLRGLLDWQKERGIA